MVDNKSVSIKSLGAKEIFDFLKNKLREVIFLFNNINYPATEKKLKDLERIRSKKMFPDA